MLDHRYIQQQINSVYYHCTGKGKQDFDAQDLPVQGDLIPIPQILFQ